MNRIILLISTLFLSIHGIGQNWANPGGQPFEVFQGVRYRGDVADSIGVSQNNYDPNPDNKYAIDRIKASAAVNITGMAGGTDGELFTFINRGSFNITFKNESSSSTAANRFTSSSGGDMILRPNSTFNFIYDATAVRWRLTSQSADLMEYKVLLTQSSSTAPAAATTLENSVPYTLTWARTSTGLYTLTISAYTAGKVFINMGQVISSTTPVVCNYTSAVSGSDWVITIKTFQNGTLADALFTATPFQLEIYP